MSLVAYGNSSDESSDENEEVAPVQKQSNGSVNGGDLRNNDVPTFPLKSASESSTCIDALNNLHLPTFAKLPPPQSHSSLKSVIEEVDDEFLRKKAVPEIRPPQKVKITIPSLKDFKDVDEDILKTSLSKKTQKVNDKGSGLLSLLPKPKSEMNFVKQPTQDGPAPTLKKSGLIPDTVRHNRPAYNTEGVDGILKSSKPIATLPRKQVPVAKPADSESSDDDAGEGDFFSLNTAESLPTVSTNEITALVAKRAAEISETATKYLNSTAEKDALLDEQTHVTEEDIVCATKRHHEQELNSEAMQALIGSNAKRRREQEKIEVMEISSEQVLPSREEWMRTALASSTAFQPTGVLVDEEPAAGTRRKHQITYLAHKAKANEAELQAMWASNRQNRRATQSKYGF